MRVACCLRRLQIPEEGAGCVADAVEGVARALRSRQREQVATTPERDGVSCNRPVAYIYTPRPLTSQWWEGLPGGLCHEAKGLSDFPASRGAKIFFFFSALVSRRSFHCPLLRQMMSTLFL